MAKSIKFLFLNVAILLLFLPLTADDSILFKGDYFLYSDDMDYLYGGGNIVAKYNNFQLEGDSLYMSTSELTGILYGNVRYTVFSKSGKDQGEVKTCDAIFFKGFPPRFLLINFGETLTFSGDIDLEMAFGNFLKKTPETLKTSSLFFEFKEFRIDKNRKIKAKFVIPYMMGMATMPFKSFTVKRGEWEQKTFLAFNNVNYSGVDGLSVSFLLRLKEKFISGDYNIKLYERGLFKMEDPKRGILFSGATRLFVGKKHETELMDFNILYNTGKESLNLRVNHRSNLKFMSFAVSQLISTQSDKPTFFEFSSSASLNLIKLIVPRFQFTHDLKKSLSYGVSTPVNLWNKLSLNFNWMRKTIRDTYRSDTSDFGTSLNLNVPFFNLSSNFNYAQNLIESSVRKNFSVNLRMKPVMFLMNNVVMDVSSFYLFSSLPFGNQTVNRISPGFNIGIHSAGALLPGDLKFVPAFTLNHLWDNREENYTDFNYQMSLLKELGNFRASIDYTMSSRYRAKNFWVEGNNRKNINFSLELKDKEKYMYLLRFYMNNDMILENTSFTGLVSLPYEMKFSSFLLFMNQEKRFQTVEIFIEKSFQKKMKIQGGYSLALKRFFIKFLTY